MKLSPINFQNTSFKGATVSITAFSDTHGQLENISNFWEEIEKNKKDLFLKEGKGKQDVVAVAGDWFMAGNVEGYKSNPNFNSQRYQLIFFNKLMANLCNLSKNIISVFAPGNHEFDAGYDEFANCAKRMRTQILMTNANLEESGDLKNYALKSKVIEVDDDKDPSLTHKVLFLGISPGNMSYYNKKLAGVAFLDDVYKPQTKITPDEVQNSIKAVRDEIEKFKSQNPKGAVVLLDHFGGIFQDELLRQKLPVNIILGAHEHLDYDRFSDSTLITKLYQNFRKFENVKINFGDDGTIEDIRTRAYYPDQNVEHQNEMNKFYRQVFKNDLQDSYLIPAQKNIDELTLKGVRYENSYLANYITDVILNRIKKVYPQVDFFAINASAIRGPLKTQNSGEVNNINLLLTLNGIREEDAGILLSNVSGKEILDIICENVLSNSQNKERNPLNHFSGLKYNKTMLLKGMKAKLSDKDLIKFVRRTQDNEPLELDRTYTLANVEKFFVKSKNSDIKALYGSNRTARTMLNAKEEFRKHFSESIDEVQASDEIRVS